MNGEGELTHFGVIPAHSLYELPRQIHLKGFRLTVAISPPLVEKHVPVFLEPAVFRPVVSVELDHEAESVPRLKGVYRHSGTTELGLECGV